MNAENVKAENVKAGRAGAGCSETEDSGQIWHTFAVCAYGDSPYLEACLRSLAAQDQGSEVIVCTSTPSPYISRLAAKYGFPVYVREGESNIREDWLFAYRMARGGYVTIAHQDDCYARAYSRELKKMSRRYPDMTVFASDYAALEMDPEERLCFFNQVWLVKKILRLPLRLRLLGDRTFFKRAALVFGNSVCCPSCAYHKKVLGDSLFRSSFSFALDWDNLYELAGREGRFICSERPLICYRVHAGAATKQCMEDNRRAEDEAAMFRKMWPKPAVRLLMRFYKKAYKAYEKQPAEGRERQKADG